VKFRFHHRHRYAILAPRRYLSFLPLLGSIITVLHINSRQRLLPLNIRFGVWYLQGSSGDSLIFNIRFEIWY
jgi:hypothetical protein